MSRTTFFLLVGPGCIVTHQAIHQAWIGQIKILIFPTITDMTGSTARPVRADTNTEIVDQIALANAHGFIVAWYQHLFPNHVPVRGAHDFRGRILMTFQTGAGNGRPVIEGIPKISRVICCRSMLRHMRPGGVIPG